jgi:glycolate oxidase iron-sulfur subunit
MQTSFTLAQLTDAATADVEKILRTCVHCGFCTATCPTYVTLGDELDSPRGRIYLIKDMLENDRPASPKVVTHLDRCLTCLSCMTTCPSGVHYMHLVDHARAYVEKTHRRPFADRALRAVLATVLPSRALFRLSLIGASLAKPFAPLMRVLPGVGPRLAAMLALAPSRFPARSSAEAPGVRPVAAARRKARVLLMTGCAQPALRPQINEATLRLLERLDVEVVVAKGEGCCGALVHHMGHEHDAHAQARRNIDVWSAEIDAAGLDAILITASGCGTTVKDYGWMFRHDPAYAAKAARVAGLARDVSEFLVGFDLAALPRAALPRKTVAYHSACSMQHGQKIADAPKALLRAVGFTVKDPPEGHLCCGSAGVYNILQPELAGALKARKLKNIAATRPDIVAAGNIGCMTQLQGGLDAPLVHTVELLDWATGGPPPPALSGA